VTGIDLCKRKTRAGLDDRREGCQSRCDYKHLHMGLGWEEISIVATVGQNYLSTSWGGDEKCPRGEEGQGINFTHWPR